MRKASRNNEAWRLEERRKEARYTMILRVGLLEQQGKSSLCLVKNVSPYGVQIKFYARPLVDAEASLRIADEPAIKGRLVWIEGGIAGMSFDDELDAAKLLRVRQKLSPDQRRSTPRVDIDTTATLRTSGRTCRAAVSDISSLGVRLRTRSALKAGDKAVITFPDLPSLNAYVRWNAGEESGLTFETPIPMQIIAEWIDRRIGGTPSPSAAQSCTPKSRASARGGAGASRRRTPAPQ